MENEMSNVMTHNSTTNKQNLSGIPITIIGAARSGVGAAKLLSSVGARVFVSDISHEDDISNYLHELERYNIPYETGKHSDQVYDAKLLVISPGVPSDAPVVTEAAKRGLRIVSELEVASWFCSVPIIAVTGTNGKTTTTTLLGRILHDAGQMHVVAGNIGEAFSSHAAVLNNGSTAIIEVSSFQLDHVEAFRPDIAVILNITPDHLDRYEDSYERYIKSKERIFMNQTERDILIYNADDPIATTAVKKAKSKLLPFSIEKTLAEGAYIANDMLLTTIDGKTTEIIARSDLLLPGLHNLANVLAAALAATVAGVERDILKRTLYTFKGVEHRLELVGELNGVRFINDSKATNVESTSRALESFENPILLLLGGKDKGNDYSRIDHLVKERVKCIIAIGESAKKVESHFKQIVPVIVAESMGEAVSGACKSAFPGDIVLLSPACASFDWFNSFEQRGTVFKTCVQNLSEQR